MSGAVSGKGFVIPKWLAWIMVFAGIIIFLAGIPFFMYSLFLWSNLRRFDATGIVMMVVGAIVAFIGYKNTGFILRREEIIDRWSVLIENGKGKADEIFIDTEGFIKITLYEGSCVIFVKRYEIFHTEILRVVVRLIGHKHLMIGRPQALDACDLKMAID